MRQVYLLFLKSQFPEKLDSLLKDDKFIAEINAVTCERKFAFKDYSVFQVRSTNRKNQGILCFGKYYYVYTHDADAAFRKRMEKLDEGELYIALKEKLSAKGQKIYSNDAHKWMDVINRFLSFEHVTQIGLFYTQTGVDTPFSIVELDLSEMNMDTLLRFEDNTLMLINN